MSSALATSALLAATAPVFMADAAPAAASATGSGQRSDRAASRVVHRDARGDVLVFDQGSGPGKPAPGDRSSDITTTVVDHGVDAIDVRAQVRQLSRSGYHLMVAEILTSNGRRYDLTVDYSSEPIDSRVTLRRFSSGAEVSCPDATWSLDRSGNRIEGSVPRSCLGDPEWVRVGVAVIASPSDLTTSSVDDSRTEGRVSDEHLELGPRQPRS